MSNFSISSPDLRRRSRRGFLTGLAIAGISTLAACSSGGSSGGGAATTPASSGSSGGSANAVTVTMTNDNKFDPATVTIPRGGTVTWSNTSTMAHSATDDPAKAANKANAQLPPGAQPWDSGLLNPGQTWSHTFDVAGTYKYFCVPHESLGMVGTINVT